MCVLKGSKPVNLGHTEPIIQVLVYFGFTRELWIFSVELLELDCDGLGELLIPRFEDLAEGARAEYNIFLGEVDFKPISYCFDLVHFY